MSAGRRPRRAARGHAWVDRSDRGFVTVTGPDAFSFLQALVSADLDPLADGDAVHSLLLTPQGKLDVDFRLAARRRRRVARLRPGARRAARGVAHPVQDPGEGRVVDRTGEFGMLSRIGGDDGDVAVPDGVHRVDTAWGYDLLGPRDALPDGRAASSTRRRSRRGASSRRSRCSRADVDDTTIPQEAFLEQDAVSFTKGCFLGQELVCRIDSRGHVNRFLRRFADIEGDWPPVGAEVVVDGKVVGALTSVAPAELPTGALGLRAPRGRAAGRGRAALGRRHRARARHLTRARGERHHEAGAHARRSARPGRRRPSPAPARARWPARCPVPSVRPGHRARRVEPLEHAREVGRRDAGPVVVDVELDLVVDRSRARRRHARRRELQRVLHQVGDDLREALRVDRRRHRLAGSRSPASTPISAAAGPNASTASLHDRVRVDRRGMQRELVRVEPGEVEQVGDEPLEPARLRRDDVGGADARVASLRRCRRRSPRRSRGSTSAACAGRATRSAGTRARGPRATSRSLAIALIALARLAELVVAHVGGVDPGGEVAAGDRPRGRLHRRERAGHAAGEVGGDERGDAERDRGGAEHRETAAAERPRVRPLRRARAPG